MRSIEKDIKLELTLGEKQVESDSAHQIKTKNRIGISKWHQQTYTVFDFISSGKKDSNQGKEVMHSQLSLCSPQNTCCKFSQVHSTCFRRSLPFGWKEVHAP